MCLIGRYFLQRTRPPPRLHLPKSGHGNSNMISLPPFKNYIIIFPAPEAYIMRTYNSDLGRRSPGGGRVLCREYVPSRHIRSSGCAIHHDLIIWDRLYMAWTGGPVAEFRLLHTVVVGSIPSGRDYGVNCWWDLIRSKQLFSASCIACGCLPDFVVMVILT